MNFPAEYIIRIYRFERDKLRRLVGTVEEVGVKGKMAFNTYDELWEILNSPGHNPPVMPAPVAGDMDHGSHR